MLIAAHQLSLSARIRETADTERHPGHNPQAGQHQGRRPRLRLLRRRGGVIPRAAGHLGAYRLRSGTLCIARLRACRTSRHGGPAGVPYGEGAFWQVL